MATDLVISKVNEVYVKVSCDRSIAQELSDFFTFSVPGHQFTPAFRNRIWDGKIRLFSLHTNQVYYGLVPYIESFCKERGYTIDYDDTQPNLADDFSVYLFEKFKQELNLHSQGKKIDARDYQMDAFLHAMRNKRTLLLSPTASGKSLIIYLIIRQLLTYKCWKGIIIVPTTSLVEQLYSDFKDYSSANGWDVESNIHRVYSGKEKTSDKSVIITTWQSVHNLPPEYFKEFDFVIGDEAHNFKAASLTKIMTNLVNAKYRIGTTGTLDGTKTHKLVLEGLFGPSYKVITTKELIDKKQLANFKIKCLVLKYEPQVCSDCKDLDYPAEMEFLVTNERRNKFIKNLALSMKNNTLILYQFVEKQGKILYNMLIESANASNRKIFFVYGKTETEIREDIRRITEGESDAIIVASYGTFSTGINIRNLHNIIFASPSKSRVRNLQSIGRGLRLGEGKEIATLFDIADDLRHKKHTNFTLKHFMERIEIYNEEKFSYKLYNISMK